jgi:uncharacterized protein (TIGR03435 family)
MKGGGRSGRWQGILRLVYDFRMIRVNRYALGNSIVAACALFALAGVLHAQPAGVPDTLKVFHPTGPLSSYDVATIKPHIDSPQGAGNMRAIGGMTIRTYISRAYGVPLVMGIDIQLENSRVVGGPAWIDKDQYDIKGKPADDLREAMDKMTREQQLEQNEMMQQSLLADRFHLKVHFETREMKVLDLLPAKGGLKITAVDPPPSGPISPPAGVKDRMPPGMTRMMFSANGLRVLDARSTTMTAFSNFLRGQPEIGGKPIVDKTGFAGNFDVKSLRFAGLTAVQTSASSSNSDPDAPSLSTALEEQLGLKLVPDHAQVEVVVIDSIDRPSEN